jgi:hypothetical protein
MKLLDWMVGDVSFNPSISGKAVATAAFEQAIWQSSAFNPSISGKAIANPKARTLILTAF